MARPSRSQFPPDSPVVLVGENNAGKSNIVRALDLVLGQAWPGTHEPEDNEFFGRDRSVPIAISVHFDPADAYGAAYTEARWQYSSANAEPVYYRALPGTRYPDAYISNDVRSTCMCVVIEAERNLNYHLSYASKYTFLSRLMYRFHKALTEDEDTKAELLRLFGEVKGRFNSIQPFADFAQILQDRLGEFSQGMTHRLQVDFEAYNPVNFFHALRLQAQEGGQPRTLAEMGTGEQQILALSFAYAYASAFHEGVLLAIEEPESHLHPLAQQWLAQRLGTMCQEGLQVLITTHSSHFLDTLHLPGFALVTKANGATCVKQLTTDEFVAHCRRSGAPADRTTVANILPFYEANATPEILEGFFAKAVVLVEGRTEALALPHLLSKCGLSHSSSGVAVIPVQGKGNLAKWRRLFTAYAIPCYVVLDNDPADDQTATKRRDALSAAGIQADELADFIRRTDWIVGNAVSLFGEDFERCLRLAFPAYAALEVEARGLGVDAKPFIARYAVSHLDPQDGSAGWASARALAAAIQALLP